MRRRQHSSGFTLIELMVAVAIIAVLAAVGYPVVVHQIYKARASEANTVLQDIREKEVRYLDDFKQYTEDLPLMPDNVTGCTNETMFWDLGSADGAKWLQLGFNPGGATYYKYRVYTPYTAAGVHDGTNPVPIPPNHPWQSQLPPVGTPWFVACARGDIDCNNRGVTFYITSSSVVVTQDNDEY